MANERKFSTGIKFRKGGLNGWHDTESPSERHAALERAFENDTNRSETRRHRWETIRKRLQVLANLTRESDPDLHRAAEADARWVDRVKE